MSGNHPSGVFDFILGTLELEELALVVLPIAALAVCLWLLVKAVRPITGDREVAL